MLIQSLKKHFPARYPEWLNAGILTSWGGYIILHPQIFDEPPTSILFRGLSDMVAYMGYTPGTVWGLGAFLIGLIQAFALFVNGAYTRTPIIRLITSFLSAFIWTQVVVGLIHSDLPNVGIVTYSWFVISNLVSAYRAGMDAVYAERQKLDHEREIGRSGSSSRPVSGFNINSN